MIAFMSSFSKMNRVHFVFPFVWHRHRVDLIKVLIDPLLQHILGVYTDSWQHLACHFAEKSFHHVQPWSMSWGKYKLKPVVYPIQIFLGLPGGMGGMVVQYKTDFVPFGVFFSSRSFKNDTKSLLLCVSLTSGTASPVSRSMAASKDNVPKRLYS